ncbi:SMP-30/gluconolactonase/LRE family protein [Psychroflexus tropicus]|uniref:SMP-30/gluconolactonase/LRE family protein n=1 Tax=Psychroflexus tropicus TaxID=197345 RepID=UPI001FE0DA46|nr:SMP-30/gluconolactonase/LRE family protein [Psychroflexus tropicus]
MKKFICTISILMLWSCNQNAGEQPKEDIKIETKTEDITITNKIEKLATDFKFTEGPAVDKKGNVYFTDIPENKIYIWTTADSLSTYREDSNGANGLYFDEEQNLYACEGGKTRITRTSPAGDYKVIASEYNGKEFNRTNDLWVNPKGGVYFTDPKYGRDQDQLPQGSMQVYYFDTNDNSVIRVTDDLIKPNGLIGTPDGKTLYITDPGANTTYQYNIENDGTLSDKSLFVEFGGDGMTIDQQGNVYLTTSGQPQVDVFSPEGKLLKSIKVPEQPSNVTFGGENRDQLFITARTSLYRVGLNKKGVQ